MGQRGELPHGPDQRQRNVGSRRIDRARRGALHRHRVDGYLDRIGTARDICEIIRDHRAQTIHLEIAGNDQRRRVRPVIRLIECARIVERCGVQFLDAADAGATIGQRVIGALGEDETAEAAIGRRKHALAKLFLHHVAFLVEHLLVDDREAHAFAVGPQHRLEIFRRDGLVVISAVGAVRGIARPADIGGQAVDHIVRHVPRLAAEDMLEQVRKAAAAFGVELRADFVPHGGSHRAGGSVGNGDDLQAVVQRPALVLDGGCRDRSAGACMVVGDGRTCSEDRKRRYAGAQNGGFHHVPTPVD